MSGGCTVGPTINVSLSEMPDIVFMEVSNTARILVVVLDSLRTACMGRPHVPTCLSPLVGLAQRGQDQDTPSPH